MTGSSRRFFLLLLLAPLAAGCATSARRPVATPRDTPAAASAPASVQGMYESGRYREVLNSVSAGVESPEALWFAAQSSLRLGQREEAARQFARLKELGASPAWQVVADLATALLAGDLETIDRLRPAAAGMTGDPFVQFELGLAHTRRNDHASAAQAFDRCADADPRFAYAYYNAGLAYDRVNRADLTIARLETFLRLAPEAPERAEVASILRAVRAR